MSPRRVLIAALSSALALSACGKRASTLERGPPLWGAEAKAEYAKERAAEEARAKAKAKAAKEQQEGVSETPPASEAPPASNPQP
jgi:hypothetical protein